MCQSEMNFRVRVQRDERGVDFEDTDEWFERCCRVVALYTQEITREVADVCNRSCFSTILQWTDYDKMMFGHIDMHRLMRKGVDVMLVLSKGLQVAWCRHASAKIVAALQHKLCDVKSRNMHYCRPETECWCVKSIIRNLHLCMLERLLCPESGIVLSLFRASFVRMRDSAGKTQYIPNRKWESMWTMILLSQIPRLGASKCISALDSDTLHMIHDFCILH